MPWRAREGLTRRHLLVDLGVIAICGARARGPRDPGTGRDELPKCARCQRLLTGATARGLGLA